MWLRLLWQLKELAPLLGKLLPLLEGWVAGNVGASAGTQKALAQLEARLGNSQEGLQDVGGQLRDQGAVLLHLSQAVQQLQLDSRAGAETASQTTARVQAELAGVRKLLLCVLAMLGMVVLALVVLGVMMLKHSAGGRG